jgi:hypothetical protein
MRTMCNTIVTSGLGHLYLSSLSGLIHGVFTGPKRRAAFDVW